MRRRSFVSALSACGLSLPFLLCACQKKTPLEVIVPFAPGGGGDILARTVLQPLQEKTGEPIVILNRPGAGGNLGTRLVAKNEGSKALLGYITNGILCVNKNLYPTQSFDPLHDLKPVAAISRMPLVATLNPKAIANVDDFDSLVRYARRHPGALSFASSGVGTTSHIAGELFAKTLGLEMTHIPHAGGAAAVKEVLAGRIVFFIDVVPNVLPHVKENRLKALAVTTQNRSPLLPELPSLVELGVPDFDLHAWDGLATGKGVPQSRIQHLNQAVNEVLATDTVRTRLARLGAQPSPMTIDQFQEFIQKEAPRWEARVKALSQSSKN